MSRQSNLEYIIDHVFLPPKLPQHDDSDFRFDASLIEAFLDALRMFQLYKDKKEHSPCPTLIRTLNNMLKLRSESGFLSRPRLETELGTMINGDILALQIRCQNAGLIIRRLEDKYRFECFELSPTNAAVIQAKGRLIRCFPGPVLEVDRVRIEDAGFRDRLSDLLVQLDSETPADMLPATTKADSKVPEIRDTIHPGLITEMLAGTLRAIGQPMEIPRIYKHTRDDVLWHDVLKPWRRSPLWLFLRVVLQTSLITDKNGQDYLWFKSFMVFFMATVANMAARAVPALSSDILFALNAKISRRALKLGGLDEPWLAYVRVAVEGLQGKLTERWNGIERNMKFLGDQPNWEPLTLNPPHDTKLTLSNLQVYLARRHTWMSLPPNTGYFPPSNHPRIRQCYSTMPTLKNILDMDNDDIYSTTVDIELWVQDCLNKWLDVQIQQDSENSCKQLAGLVHTYLQGVNAVYTNSPEDISIILLTLMEIWVAMDKVVTRHFPLLREYRTGFPLSVFEPMLLPKRNHLDRLYSIELYLQKREEMAVAKLPSIFQSAATPDSFGVRYFDQSSDHQKLRKKIEEDASRIWSDKVLELAAKKEEYERLLQESTKLGCVGFSESGEKDPAHHKSCKACDSELRARSLVINIFEYPLPAKVLEAKFVTFELNVPEALHIWRDTTYSILVDWLTNTSPSEERIKQKVYRLDDFSGLKPFLTPSQKRLNLASIAKPFANSHYKSQQILIATEASIYVQNSSRYEYYDPINHQWIVKLLNRYDISEKCSLKLPAELYEGLQYAVNSTTHTTNEVIARQASRPLTMTMHEFYAFATLRSGHRLQWRNIARELAAPVLHFNHEEVHILFAQACWQAGPLCKMRSCRQAHVDLEEDDFGLTLQSVLDLSLESIKRNWQGAPAMRTFIILATRLLSLSSSPVVHQRCLHFLRMSQNVILNWMHDLIHKLHKSQEEKRSKDLNVLLLEIALTCSQTFDIDIHHLYSLLRSEEEFATATECFIIVHGRCPTVTDGLPCFMQTLLKRHKRLLHRIEPFLRHQLSALSAGLDKTVKLLWAGYESSGSWTAFDVPKERWLVTRTRQEGNISSVMVHYNILNGNLLVDGFPLTRLPRVYESHPTYRRLFGKKVLEVVPSTMIGMIFEVRNEMFGCQAHFAMQGSDLVIRTRKNNQIYELLPIHALEGDFPESFVRDYFHWLNLSTQSVEWRPLLHPWISSDKNWHMHTNHQGNNILSRGLLNLVDIQSPTATLVSLVLAPLENAAHLHVTINIETKDLHVHLQRLKLDFFLKQGASHLESNQFRNMAIDESQLFGTMTGLVNRLVLRGIKDSSRLVIVPNGGLHCEKVDHHIRVRVDTSTANDVSYYVYHIDYRLGRLVDNGSLKSKLFKCYIHALTGHCLVDELTGRTGTEEALSCLQSAAALSFVSLDLHEIKLLEMIAGLTPQRRYYPRHLRVMQEVTWNNALSPISHHSSFLKLVQSIFRQAKISHLFHPESTQLPDYDEDRQSMSHLLGRAAIRDSVYRVFNFGAEDHTTDLDMTYSARDLPVESDMELRVCRAAKSVDDWSPNLRDYSNLLQSIESWGESILGCKSPSLAPLGYNKRWLDSHKSTFPEVWCTLQKALSQSVKQRDRYGVMFLISALSYSRHVDESLVQILLAFATIPALRKLRPPGHDSFHLSAGYGFNWQTLNDAIRENALPFSSCPEVRLPRLSSESKKAFSRRRKGAYQSAVSSQAKILTDLLAKQWPSEIVHAPSQALYSTYISLNKALEDCGLLFRRWSHNIAFREYIISAQPILNERVSNARFQINIQPYPAHNFPYKYHPPCGVVNLESVFGNPPPSLPSPPPESFNRQISLETTSRDDTRLRSLLSRLLSESSGSYESNYALDLWNSFWSFPVNDVALTLKESHMVLTKVIQQYLQQSKSHVQKIYSDICQNLETEKTLTSRLSCITKMRPRLSAISLLELLRSSNSTRLTKEWRASLTQYGLAITTLQRTERLMLMIGSEADLLRELRTSGHEGWNPMDYPDWLLFEIDNNILIRPEQAEIGLEMISPSSGTNSVMQLNMGEGKSSVIVPTVAAALADGNKLVRVVVLKSLSVEMFQLLVKKLGGLVGRRIFHLPISRSFRFELDQVLKIKKICQECMLAGGVLLMQPEHLLSLELMGVEHLLSEKKRVGKSLIQIQQWLNTNSRDILDESDEILSVHFELIYTIGSQQMVEFSPDRWITVQNILGLVGGFAEKALAMFPEGLEVNCRCPGSFPRIRILQSTAGSKLLDMIATEVCGGRLPGVRLWNFPPHLKIKLFKFLTNPSTNESYSNLLQDDALSLESTRKALLLIKGLIAGGVLIFALQHKRWRVNYGFDFRRTMLAVPYRAKDTPAARAEFSHPDVIIVLTCMSYYYQGLSDEQLYTSFQLLLLLENASEEYNLWIRNSHLLPKAFAKLTGVNLSDGIQCTQMVFPSLRYSKATIDFYLTHVVFPKEMKEFPQKLSSSGWDIVREKAHVTTGFSGTNDSRYMLPLSISQRDLPQQLHTNAAVLGCLLKPENTVQTILQASGAESSNAELLLRTVIMSDPPVRVILDVGAQVLELQNDEVARTWLQHVSAQDAQAAIFFDNNNELSVMNREGVIETLMVFSFAKQLDQCLVFLDEAHTRGTDLKLPNYYRAAVTLGPHLTKDRLLQACMRMRKLGKGQSVMFCAPPEVQRSILECCGRPFGSKIEVDDILRWSISETLAHTRSCIPIWATQGIRYQHRHIAWKQLSHKKKKDSWEAISQNLLEKEAQSIEDRYGLNERQSETQLHLAIKDSLLVTRRKQLNAVGAKCEEFELEPDYGTTLHEEQERELLPEMEQERQVERPPVLEPCVHNLHPHVKLLIATGTLQESSDAFQHAFKILRNTSAVKFFDASAWPADLLVTADFARTVKLDSSQRLDWFLRPVHWIISCGDPNMPNLVILSPYEVQELLPLIRERNAVTLHVYSPRTSISMQTMDSLAFCALPPIPPFRYAAIPSIIRHLNIFAGQLYLRNYEEYVVLCRFLGVCYRVPDEGIEVSGDGFVDRESRPLFDQVMARVCPFTKSPVEFLKVFMGLRRKELSFKRSHLGGIVQGEPLGQEEFDIFGLGIEHQNNLGRW
ncbi:MAG: hypothetical protein M1834_007819 [Cirrosporium novae-zelandiae]|nr:MAG: hypothetical protein M1834_007819 [Cirrosporium novae-zelandiae]